MSRVWIINQYSSTPETGMGGRHHYLSRELAQRGHDVSLIAAHWHHLLGEGAETAPAIEMRDGYRFVRVPVPRYAHAHDKRRILNWILFGRRLRHLPERLGEVPDTILYSSPSLLGFLGAHRLARKTGARLVFEVRDIWPLSLQEVGGKSPHHPLIAWMQRVEDRAYAVSDAVVSNLPNAVDHMVTRGMDRAKFTWVPNGFSREEVETPEQLEPETVNALPADKFLIGYTGTIGAANALETMVGAAEYLKDRTDIAFVIVGKGRERDRIAADIARRGLQNIHLIGAIPKRQVQSMLARFDACYIGLTHDPLFRFGVSPNKLFDYLISGKPILYGIDSGRYCPVEELKAGLQISPEDPQALADAVLTLNALPKEDRDAMGARGRQAALEHHEYGALAAKLEQVLFP